jgi:hypothetical protein
MPVLKLGSLLFPRERLYRWLEQRTQGTRALRQQVHSSANGASAKEQVSA